MFYISEQVKLGTEKIGNALVEGIVLVQVAPDLEAEVTAEVEARLIDGAQQDVEESATDEALSARVVAGLRDLDQGPDQVQDPFPDLGHGADHPGRGLDRGLDLLQDTRVAQGNL